MKAEIIREIERIVGKDRVRRDEPLSEHTTFKTGGPAEVFAIPGSTEALTGLILMLNREAVPYFILGNGSNVLAGDRGFKGAVLQIAGNNYQVRTDKEKGIIEAESGILLSKLSRLAAENSLTGMEFASGIPGTLGGAVVMNAGAYGGEMKQVVESVTLLDIKKGELVTRSCGEMRFAYRDSLVKHGDYAVIRAVIRLDSGEKNEILEKMEELCAKRNEKQPLNFPSAGSTFKRPEGYFAGKLIEDSGLKGYSVGGAQVSEKHCGFVINRGNATSADIKKLIDDVRRIVYEKQGVMLEPEVVMTGEFE